MSELSIIKYDKARFEKNSLVIYDSITLDEWKELGQSLKQVEGCVQFWIGDWARYGDKRGFTGKYTDPKVYDELEEITGLEHQTLKNYKTIAENVPTSVRLPELSFSHHSEVAKLTTERQSAFLQRAVDEKLSVRDLREEIRKADVITTTTEFPQNKYRIILADPPWKYGNSMPEYFTEQANYYSLMTIDEICEMPINTITEDNAVLFLWVTSPILENSFKVINSWGFKYKTSFVWDKIKHNMGHYNSVRHEFLLVCTKGSCTPDVPKLYDSVISIERTEHSAKPEYFREIIDTIYPHGNRIELFARVKTNNWDVYGNQM